MGNPEVLLRILFCDDDQRFAQTQVENLCRKLKTRHGLGEVLSVQSLSHLARLRSIAGDSQESTLWDLVFCDLGWSELTLEGIQLLHDFQLSNPSVYAVLYTAQDENEVISQALEWKFNFIDQIIKIDHSNYFEKILDVILFQFHKRRLRKVERGKKEAVRRFVESYLNAFSPERSEVLESLCNQEFSSTVLYREFFPEYWHYAKNLKKYSKKEIQYFKSLVRNLYERIYQEEDAPTFVMTGLNLLPEAKREWVQTNLVKPLKEAQNNLKGVDPTNTLSLESLISGQRIQVRLKPNMEKEQSRKLYDLIQTLALFPRVGPHDLIPLSKNAYIRFIREKYGGFPQMAEARHLDLNNIYRANRRFKNQPFLVFKMETIEEIIGDYDPIARENKIRELLAPREAILESIKKSNT